MKTYESEKQFTEMFANDVNNGVKEYSVNGIEFSVSGKYQNSSKAAVYQVTVNGMDREVTIIQLKKLLNVTYKKEYNRTGERATAAGTKVVIKSDEELQATASTIREAVDADIDRLVSRCRKYGVNVSINFSGTDVAQTWYDRARTIRDNKLAEERAEEERKAQVKAQTIDKAQVLTQQLQAALAKGDLLMVAELSAKLTKITK